MTWNTRKNSDPENHHAHTPAARSEPYDIRIKQPTGGSGLKGVPPSRRILSRREHECRGRTKCRQRISCLPGGGNVGVALGRHGGWVQESAFGRPASQKKHVLA